jgi:dolichyl-phosphate beta-glucosyltransferase
VSDFCLVVPCYNEASRLNVAAFDRFLGARPTAHLCFVNDGSTDGTEEVLAPLTAGRPQRVLVLSLPKNAGKAEAVRQGMLRAATWKPFGYIGYWDADLATPLDEVDAMLQTTAARTDCVMVLGLRLKRLGAGVERSAARHYLGRVFATCASLVLRLPVYDTQCGAKLVQGAMVPQLFDEPFRSRWIFDVELLARLRNLVGVERMRTRVVEYPLQQWHDVRGSKVSPMAWVRAPRELLTIWRRYG